MILLLVKEIQEYALKKTQQNSELSCCLDCNLVRLYMAELTVWIECIFFSSALLLVCPRSLCCSPTSQSPSTSSSTFPSAPSSGDTPSRRPPTLSPSSRPARLGLDLVSNVAPFLSSADEPSFVCERIGSTLHLKKRYSSQLIWQQTSHCCV